MENSTKVKRKFCVDCEIELFDVARNTQRCKTCAMIRRRLYQRWYHRWYQKEHRDLGTTDFSPHRNPDFTLEYLEILDEMDKLGIISMSNYVKKEKV